MKVEDYKMALGILEIEILNTMWILQKENEDVNISVKDIVEKMDKKGLVRAYTTIKTVMDRLSQKELLVRYRVGKKFYYKTVSDKEEMAKNALSELLNQFFNGSKLELIQFLEKDLTLVTK